MIVLNKKKIRLTILIVFVLVFGVAILKDNKESVPTVSLPISGKTIVIDAGHGKPDEGEFLLTLTKMTNLIQQNKVFRHFIFLCQ